MSIDENTFCFVLEIQTFLFLGFVQYSFRIVCDMFSLSSSRVQTFFLRNAEIVRKNCFKKSFPNKKKEIFGRFSVTMTLTHFVGLSFSCRFELIN